MSEHNTNSYVVSTDGLGKDFRHHILRDKNYMSKTDIIKAHLNRIDKQLEAHLQHIMRQDTTDTRLASYMSEMQKIITDSNDKIRRELNQIESHQATQDQNIADLQFVYTKKLQAMNGR